MGLKLKDSSVIRAEIEKERTRKGVIVGNSNVHLLYKLQVPSQKKTKTKRKHGARGNKTYIWPPQEN